MTSDRPNFVGRLWYNGIYWLMYTAFTFGFSHRRQGWGNLPAKGPVLILSNHYSMLDPMAAGLGMRRYLSFLARKNLLDNPVFGAFLRSMNTIPIDRKMGKDGIQAVLDALGRGQAVLMFPEGERAHAIGVQPLKPGVSLLIKRVRCPIVPVGLAGTFGAYSRFMKRPRLAPLFLPPNPATIAVSVGKPIDPKRYDTMTREEMLQDLHAAMVAQHAAAERLRRK